MPALDGLRAVAVLLVVAFHARLPGFAGGFIGVDVFFVLSGYLVTALMLSEWQQSGSCSYRAFLVRRVARIGPAVVALSFGVAGYWLMRGAPLSGAMTQILPVLSYVSNYMMAYSGQPTFLAHSWSLSVEMHFYVFWPLVFLALVRRRNERVAWRVALTAAIAVIAWRTVCATSGYELHAYYATDTRISGLLVGAAMALAAVRLGEALANPVLVAAVAVLAVLVTRGVFLSGSSPILNALTDLAAAGLVIGAAQGRGIVVRVLSSGMLVRLGVLSYGLYLWHFPIAVVIGPRWNPSVTFVTVLSVSLLLAYVSHNLIERPARRWILARWLPDASARRTAAVAGAHDDDAAHAGQRDVRE